MAKLIATRGIPPVEMGSWELAEGAKHTLGRDFRGAIADFKVECTDRFISKLHVELMWENDRLTVRRLAGSKNIVWMRGQDQGFHPFEIRPGESFRIGETDFELDDPRVPDEAGTAEPKHEFSYSTRELKEFTFSDADERIEILARLPEVIRNAETESALKDRIAQVLLEGIPRARSAMLVRFDSSATEADLEIEAHRRDDGSTAPPRCSHRLVREALEFRRQTVFHCWYPNPSGSIEKFTSLGDYTWAFCTPVLSEFDTDVGLYVSGTLRPMDVLGPNREVKDKVEEKFKGDLKFSELVADIYNSLLARKTLQLRSAYLERFLSPAVLDALLDTHTDLDTALEHRLADVAVMFCDLRGSSRIVEKGAEDLQRTWNTIRSALDVMTSNIVAMGGVVSDFQGDAAMAFWGWPLDSDEAWRKAVQTATDIQDEFRREKERGGPAGAFRFGIGIASGRALAGKLGTFDQFKVGVFGPPVNLASRLEGLTQVFQAPILLDEETANKIENDPSQQFRIRRLAKVQPAGMGDVVEVNQLLGDSSAPADIDHQESEYAKALESFERGDWQKALDLMATFEEDGPAQLLKTFIEEHNGTPPTSWDGVIRFGSKRFYQGSPSSRA